MQVFQSGRSPIRVSAPGARSVDLRKALLRARKNPVMLEALLELVALEGRQDQAAEVLCGLAHEDPHPSLISSRWARALVQLGKPEAAVKILGEALARQPLEAVLQLELGETLHGLGHAEEARAAYHSALRLEPNHELALKRYCASFDGAGEELEGALTALTALPGAWRARLALAARLLAAAAASAEEKARAFDLCHTALAEAANSNEALRECASMWHQRGDWRELVTLLLPGDADSHRDPRSGSLLVHALLELGRASEAASILHGIEAGKAEESDAMLQALRRRVRLLEARRISVTHTNPPPEEAGLSEREEPTRHWTLRDGEPELDPGKEANELIDDNAPEASNSGSIELLGQSSLAIAQGVPRPEELAPPPTFQLLPGRSSSNEIALEGPLWRNLPAVKNKWIAPTRAPRLVAFSLAVEQEDPGSLALARVLPVWMLQHWQIEGRITGVSVFSCNQHGEPTALRRMPTLMEMRSSVSAEEPADLLLRGRIARDARGRDWVDMELWDANLACVIARPRVRLRSQPVRAARRLIARLTAKLGDHVLEPPLAGLRPWPSANEEDQLEWAALDDLIGATLGCALGEQVGPGDKTLGDQILLCEDLLRERPERALSHLIVGARIAAELSGGRLLELAGAQRIEKLIDAVTHARGIASRQGETRAGRSDLRALLTDVASYLRTFV